MPRFTAVVLLVGSAVGCTKPENKAPDTAKPAMAAPTGQTSSSDQMKLGETTGLKTPESVRYDPELDVFYVSNINGNPSQHDGNGFIVVVPADSMASVRTLVESGKNGAKLDGPKGLALIGDTLWVTDIDHVRAFNRRTGAPIADIDLSSHKATFLNDAVIGPDGSVYVTDSGIAFDDKGNVSHPGIDQVFKITGRTVTVFKADSLDAPNGITWDAKNNRFLIATFQGNAVKTWKPGDKATATLATGPGAYDGIEVLGDGRILVTSWTDSTVHLVQNGTMSTLVTNVSGPADIGIDTKRSVLVVPRFNDNKIEYYRIP